jgi:transcriptional regulator with XRE-family HTH domain
MAVTTKAFQQTVKQRRAAFGFTQRVLAKKLGCKASHVAYLENGRRRPSLGLLLRLAKVLGVRPATLALQAIPELAAYGVK